MIGSGKLNMGKTIVSRVISFYSALFFWFPFDEVILTSPGSMGLDFFSLFLATQNDRP